MNDIDDLDRILLSEEPLAPSSGFAAAVMDSVHAAAAEPPPLPFPWTRFAAGAIACGVWAAAGAALIATIDLSSLVTAAQAASYAAAAVLASFALLRVQRQRTAGLYLRPPTSSR